MEYERHGKRQRRRSPEAPSTCYSLPYCFVTYTIGLCNHIFQIAPFFLVSDLLERDLVTLLILSLIKHIKTLKT
ncbi:hypothetical protein CARUB_v10025614mg [Capsella rubella]|uniref:Uncharacterized protein n=1 Tax=Capsella rubella TaxID=81985 RepID=R0G1P6_9BRAS|nr:hypothetical protein CARUB_v10025614mg [Capsella rubella]